MKKITPFAFLLFLTILVLTSCSSYEARKTSTPDRIIYISILSDPAGAKIFWRVVSSTPEVQSTNRFYMGLTPNRSTRPLDIPGLTVENSKDVTIVVELEKEGYFSQSERFNSHSLLTDQALSLNIDLKKK